MFSNLSVLMVGMGKSGKSCARFLTKKGARVIGVDREAQPFGSVEVVSDLELIDVKRFDLAVVSPGIDPGHPLLIALEKQGVEMISEIEVALRSFSKDKLLIGVTGTNGKTTTTEMMSHALNTLGIRAKAVGNNGWPLTDCSDEEGVLVVELSSFQLEKTYSKALDVAVLLRITPDHLDRYKDFQEYAETKARIASLLKERGTLILHKNTAHLFPELAEAHETTLIGYGGFPENVQAVIAALNHFGKTSLEVRQALASFKAPPHRMEWVKELQGVNYYNDSKATNVDSVLYALQSMKGPLFLIAGGKHKGHSYKSWRPFLKEKVKKVYLIGEAALEIEKDLVGAVELEHCVHLEKAVEVASKEAFEGSCVLLSPGCSSFDQFKNYEERGQKFKELIETRIVTAKYPLFS